MVMNAKTTALREAIEQILSDAPGAISALYGPFTDDPEKEAEIVYDSMIDQILALLQTAQAESQLDLVRKLYLHIANQPGCFVKTAVLTYLNELENELRAALNQKGGQ